MKKLLIIIFLLFSLNCFALTKQEKQEKYDYFVQEVGYHGLRFLLNEAGYPKSNPEVYFKKLINGSGNDAKWVNIENEIQTVKDWMAEQEAEKVGRGNEVDEIKSFIPDINSSDKPQWEKKLLKRIIKDMKK